MKFKRVDKSTVRCIITENEINERGINIEDLMRNGDKVQDFLNEVVDMAEAEVGFKMTSGVQAVQAAFLPNHDVVFTFSDNTENIGMDRALEHLKDMISDDGVIDVQRIDDIRGLEGKEQSDAFSDLLREIQDAKKEPEEQINDATIHFEDEEKVVGQKISNTVITILFENLDYVCRFCKGMPGAAFRGESLYKMNTQYALVLDTLEIGKEEMSALYLQASEYAVSFTRNERRAGYIAEHEACIISNNAVSILQDL